MDVQRKTPHPREGRIERVCERAGDEDVAGERREVDEIQQQPGDLPRFDAPAQQKPNHDGNRGDAHHHARKAQEVDDIHAIHSVAGFGLMRYVD